LKTWQFPRIPRSANRMLRAHWAARRRDRESWRQHVRRACGRRRSRMRGRVDLRVLVYRRHRQDPDNAYASMKNLLDALVLEGWLEDDSSDLLGLEVEEREEPRKANEKTVVWWTPVSPEAPRSGGPRKRGGLPAASGRSGFRRSGGWIQRRDEER
jgi:hypothetical protein